MERLERIELSAQIGALAMRFPAIQHQGEMRVAGRLSASTKYFGPICESCRQVDAKRHARLSFQDRIRPLLFVAISIVERDTGEAPAEIALCQATVHLVKLNQVDGFASEAMDDAGEKLGRHFELLVRLEHLVPRWAHMVHHEDRANAAEEGAQQHVRPTEAKRFKSKTNKPMLQLHWTAGLDGR